jgi:hypothetical protein
MTTRGKEEEAMPYLPQWNIEKEAHRHHEEARFRYGGECSGEGKGHEGRREQVGHHVIRTTQVSQMMRKKTSEQENHTACSTEYAQEPDDLETETDKGDICDEHDQCPEADEDAKVVAYTNKIGW